LDDEVIKEIEEINEAYNVHKDKVIALLLENVMNVHIEVPEVVKSHFE
jgi:hypothetical protein